MLFAFHLQSDREFEVMERIMYHRTIEFCENLAKIEILPSSRLKFKSKIFVIYLLKTS